jgi:hypothetical protein
MVGDKNELLARKASYAVYAPINWQRGVLPEIMPPLSIPFAVQKQLDLGSKQ